MKKVFKSLMIVMTIALSLFALTACSSDVITEEKTDSKNSETVDTSLQSVIESGVLRVGMCPEYPPFESINKKNEIVGFDPSLAAATDAVELSENYYSLADVIVVKADNGKIKSKEDLVGKIIGIQDSTTAAQAAEGLLEMGIKVGEIKHYKEMQTLMQNLLMADFILGNAPGSIDDSVTIDNTT